MRNHVAITGQIPRTPDKKLEEKQHRQAGLNKWRSWFHHDLSD
jgi:hypothetical protein